LDNLSGGKRKNLPNGAEFFEHDINDVAKLVEIMKGVEFVYHFAALPRVQFSIDNPLESSRANIDGTLSVLKSAHDAGVKRVIYVSSIGVNGNNSGFTPYRETDAPRPCDRYSISKHEAEEALKEVSRSTKMDAVIIRPPLVYGPGNAGNFLRLLNMVWKRMPMPLASIRNRKSFIYIGNLADALTSCAFHPNAAGKTYLVSDGQDISTTVLIRQIGDILGKPTKMFALPASLIRFLCILTGRKSIADKLLNSVIVDTSTIRQELKWSPPYTLSQGLRETSDWYRSTMNLPANQMRNYR